MQRKILVIGSLNADLVQNVERLPHTGETIEGSELQVFCGGKGANQAYAAARLSGAVSMAGLVGNDVFGERLRLELKSAGVDVSRVGTSSKSTGAATIFVFPSGENVIVLSPGANADVSPSFAVEALQECRAGDLLLCQLEIPIDTVCASLAAARVRGMFTILDPAPARSIPVACFDAVDVLTPNQNEAAAILGISGEEIVSLENAERAAMNLLQKGPKAVVVKMGGLGCVVAAGGNVARVQAHTVTAIDTTAAGDTFNGALAVALSEGADLVEAAHFANGAAALSVTLAGAMRSMPDRTAVGSFLKGHSVTAKGE